jgi:hypothetical protein
VIARVDSCQSLEGSVNGVWLGAAGAARQYAPAALGGRFRVALNFTVSEWPD